MMWRLNSVIFAEASALFRKCGFALSSCMKDTFRERAPFFKIRRTLCFRYVRYVYVLLFAFCANGSFETKAPEGFVWYKESIKKKDQTTQKLKREESKSLSATQKNEALSKAFEGALHEAIETPTLENVKRVQALQHLIIQRSEKFSEVWMLSSLMDTLLYDKKANPNSRHIELMKEEDKENRRKSFGEISKTYGVFFVWKEGCRYCHEFLPVVQDFCKTYGFDLMAVSKEGGSIPGVKSVKDNGMITKLNTKEIYPAVFLAHFKSGDVYPISWGMGAFSDLEANTKLVINHIKEQK